MSDLTEQNQVNQAVYKAAKLTSFGLEQKKESLLTFLPEIGSASTSVKDYDCVLGWGFKANTKKLRLHALREKMQFINLEDGFIRSIGLGSEGYTPISLIADYKGIYYNPRRKSDFEVLLRQDFSKEKESRASSLITHITEHQITKYNTGKNLSEISLHLPPGPKVLIVDQTYSDCSVTFASQGQKSFDEMFESARSFYPNAKLLIKTHPEQVNGSKGAYLKKYYNKPDVFVVTEDVNSYSLFEEVDAVFTVSSLTGFEALVAGKKVFTFGTPFYAGYGLTVDCSQKNYIRRNFEVSLQQLAHTAYIDYPRYINPFTSKLVEVETALDILSDVKSKYIKNKGVFYCSGFSKWKRPHMLEFFKNPFNQVQFCNSENSAFAKAKSYNSNNKKCKASVLTWAARRSSDAYKRSETAHVKLLNVEDGFIRSVGLGSNFIPASSLVIDGDGIYYDSSRPSHLEKLIAELKFDDAKNQRISAVIDSINSNLLTKYNFVDAGIDFVMPASGAKKILVIGQVEDDASVKNSPSDYKSNLKLLKTARERNLDSFIIYKPHPDVVSGNRVGDVPKYYLDRFADVVTSKSHIIDLINHVDEVYTISSLTGFEALLRGKKVFTFGTPFYAGYGLTIDECKQSRLAGHVQLNHLVYAALISYPQYFDRISKLPCEVEVVVDNLVNKRKQLENIEKPDGSSRLVVYLKGLFNGL